MATTDQLSEERRGEAHPERGLHRRLPDEQRPVSTMAALLDDVRQSELSGVVDDAHRHVQEQQILALSRKRIDAEEAPKGKRLEAVKQ